jgi:hypothetical protein
MMFWSSGGMLMVQLLKVLPILFISALFGAEATSLPPTATTPSPTFLGQSAADSSSLIVPHTDLKIPPPCCTAAMLNMPPPSNDRVVGLEELRHFMGFDLNKTTLVEIQKAWGNNGRLGIGKYQASLRYTIGPLIVEFIGRNPNVQIFSEYEVYTHAATHEADASLEKIQANSEHLILPSGLTIGMSQDTFFKNITALYKKSPEYEDHSQSSEVTDTIDFNFCLKNKSPLCSHLSLAAYFDPNSLLYWIRVESRDQCFKKLK